MSEAEREHAQKMREAAEKEKELEEQAAKEAEEAAKAKAEAEKAEQDKANIIKKDVEDKTNLLKGLTTKGLGAVMKEAKQKQELEKAKADAANNASGLEATKTEIEQLRE